MCEVDTTYDTRIIVRVGTALALAREEIHLGNVAAARELLAEYGADPRPDLRPGWGEVRAALDSAAASTIRSESLRLGEAIRRFLTGSHTSP